MTEERKSVTPRDCILQLIRTRMASRFRQIASLDFVFL